MHLVTSCEEQTELWAVMGLNLTRIGYRGSDKKKKTFKLLNKDY